MGWSSGVLTQLPPSRAPCLCHLQLSQGTAPAQGCGATIPLQCFTSSPWSRIGPRIPKGLCLEGCSPPSPRGEQCPRAAAGTGPPFQAGSAPRRTARLAVRGSPPDLAGGSTGIRIGGLVPGVGQDLDAVPAAGASHCPRQQLCPSRWPRQRAAPSHHSAAPGCRRPVEGPHRLGQSPWTPVRGSPAPLPTLYLQSLEEAEGAQAPAPGHDAEGGVVQQLLVVKPGVGDEVGVRHGPRPPVSIRGMLLAPGGCGARPGQR